MVFVLHIDNHGFCPVFIQLKAPAFKDQPTTLSAPVTVMAYAAQGLLGEIKLERFCTVFPKRFFGVVIDYPIEQEVDDSYLKRESSELVFAAQGEQTLQCISLKIDESNIHSLFPKAHREKLDLLQGIIGELEKDI
ncbi:hypothetical protein BG005_003462 [Podila minutissima]|nr:hypothetical protein BG005_003462 [Podila minutissima]